MSNIASILTGGGPIDPRSATLNYVTCNGVQSPGRAQWTGIEAPYNWQVQEGYALSGAWVIFRGRGIAKPTLTLTLWLPEHFEQWAIWKKAIAPPTTTKPYFVEMQHPLLASAGIKALGVESIGEPEKQAGDPFWHAAIRLIEYRPPSFSLVKPDKSIPAVAAGKPIPPKTEADIALAKAITDMQASLAAGRK